MRKFLLLAALAASCAPAFADEFSDIFTVTFEGETIANGQTITVRNYYDPIIKDYPELAGDDWEYSYYNEADVRATNITDEPKQLEFSLKLVEPNAYADALGAIQLCYEFETAAGNCLAIKDGILDFTSGLDPVPGEEYISMKVEQRDFATMDPITLQLDLRVLDDNKVAGTSTVFIAFTHEQDITMGVAGIESESKVEYYTIDGVRIAQPQKGHIYIERKGTKISKRIF